jgi:hypothetical protein
MAPGDFDPAGMSAETLWYKMAGTGPYYSTELTKLQGAIDAWKSRSGSARNIRIAATAFNIVNGTYYYRDAQGSARMRSVAGLASLKNIAIRAQPWMAFHYSLAGGPAGLVGWDAEAMAAGAPLETGGYLVHKLYSDLARPQSFPVTVTAPSYTTWYGGWDPVSGAILDAAATSDSSLNSMTIFVANRKFSAEPVLTMIKTGAFVGGTAKAHVVAGKGPDVYNIVAKPGEISLSVEDLGKVGKEFKYAFRPYSVTAVELVK